MRWICAVKEADRQEAKELIPNGGWNRGCSESGEYPATYYMCNWVQPSPEDFANMDVLGIEYMEKLPGPSNNTLANFTPPIIKIQVD